MSRFIQAGVLKIAYFDHGPSSGKIVLLLHGLPAEKTDGNRYGEIKKFYTKRRLTALEGLYPIKGKTEATLI